MKEKKHLEKQLKEQQGWEEIKEHPGLYSSKSPPQPDPRKLEEFKKSLIESTSNPVVAKLLEKALASL